MRILLLILAFAYSLLAYEPVAKLLSLQGEVHVRRENMLMLFKEGMDLTVQDVIDSRSDGRAKVVFSDETVVTVGANTTFKIEEYLSDESNSKLNIDSRRGTLRVVSGQIGKVAPNNFKIKSKTATMGIRGTQFVISIESDKESILCTEGEITVASKTDDGIESEPLVVGAGEVVSATFEEEIYDEDEAPSLETPKPIVAAFVVREATAQEKEELFIQLDDGAQETLDTEEIIKEYKKAVAAPSPTYYREMHNPNPNKLQLPKLKDHSNPESLERDLRRKI